MTLDRRAVRWVVAGILLASLAVRVASVLAIPLAQPTEDAARYDMAARRILAGRGFAYPLERTTATAAQGAAFERFAATPTNAFTTPGLAYWLAGIWAVTGQGPGRWLAARLANCLLATLALLLLYLIAVRVAGRRAALVTLALAALFPPLVWVVAYLLTEPLFVASLLGWVLVTLVALERRDWRWFAASGAMLGLVTLVRPTAALWVACVAVWMLAGRRYSLRAFASAAVVTALGFILVMSPWWVRNTERYGRPVWLTTSGANVLAAATSPGYRAGGRPLIPWPAGVTDDEALGRYWSRLARTQAAAILRDDPLGYVGARFFTARYAVLHPWPPPPRLLAWMTPLTGWYWCGVMGLGVVGLVARRRESLLWLVVSMGAAIFLVHAVTLMLDRYLHPVLWIAMLPAAVGAVAIGEALARRRGSGRPG